MTLASKWSEIHVANEPCAPIPFFQRYFAAVERFEFNPVGHAEYCCVRQLIDHHLHDLVLRFFIKRRRRFIEDDNIGVVQEKACKCEPLLFPT